MWISTGGGGPTLPLCLLACSPGPPISCGPKGSPLLLLGFLPNLRAILRVLHQCFWRWRMLGPRSPLPTHPWADGSCNLAKPALISTTTKSGVGGGRTQCTLASAVHSSCPSFYASREGKAQASLEAQAEPRHSPQGSWGTRVVNREHSCKWPAPSGDGEH